MDAQAAEPLHILFVTHYFAPDGGAAAVRLSYLARWLAARGHRVTVLTTPPHYPQGRIAAPYAGRWSVTEDWEGVRVVRAWLWATPSPRISRKLPSQLSFSLSAGLRGLPLPRPDVVLIEAQPIFTGLIGRALAALKRAPVVLNVSDLWPDHLLSVGALDEHSRVYRLARWAMDTGYRSAAHIVALSPEWARRIQPHAPHTPITALFRGVDTQALHPGLDPVPFLRAHKLSAHEQIISFIGTFATQYDFTTWLDVAAHFSERQDVRFVLVGGGSQEELVRQRLADDPRLARVRWIPWLPAEQVASAWAASTLTGWAMRPAELYQGTLPAKLYEALAMGVPLVAAQEGEAAQLIRESGGGLVVPPGDVLGMVQAIEHLLAHPAERQRLSQAGRASAESHYDFRANAAIYERILREASQLSSLDS